MEEIKILQLLVCDACKSTHMICEGNGIYVCENCGAKKIIISEANKSNMQLISKLTDANSRRTDHLFKEAYSRYKEILLDDPREAAALEGLVLSKYGIEYVKDTTYNKYLPTCHYLDFEKISEDDLYKKCINKIDETSRELIKEKTKKIEKLMDDIQKVYKDKSEEYDIFISCKITDPETNEKTYDYKLAYNLYNELNKKYKVFFSPISVTIVGRDYEPYICNAIQKAKVFILVGTKKEYVDAAWVKNEYSRFITKLNDNNISSDHFINVCNANILQYMPIIGSAPQGIFYTSQGYQADISLALDKLFKNELTCKQRLEERKTRQKAKKMTITFAVIFCVIALLFTYYFTRPIITFTDYNNSIISKEKNGSHGQKLMRLLILQGKIRMTINMNL